MSSSIPSNSIPHQSALPPQRNPPPAQHLATPLPVPSHSANLPQHGPPLAQGLPPQPPPKSVPPPQKPTAAEETEPQSWGYYTNQTVFYMVDPWGNKRSLSAFIKESSLDDKERYIHKACVDLWDIFCNGSKLNADQNKFLCRHSRGYISHGNQTYRWQGAEVTRKSSGDIIELIAGFMERREGWVLKELKIRVLINDKQVRDAETFEKIVLRPGFQQSPVFQWGRDSPMKVQVKNFGQCILSVDLPPGRDSRIRWVPLHTVGIFTGGMALNTIVSVDDISKFAPVEILDNPLIDDALRSNLSNQIIVISTRRSTYDDWMQTLENFFDSSPDVMMTTIGVVRRPTTEFSKPDDNKASDSDRDSDSGSDSDSDIDGCGIEDTVSRLTPSSKPGYSLAINSVVPGKQVILFRTISKAEDQADIHELVKAKHHMILFTNDADAAMQWLPSQAVGLPDVTKENGKHIAEQSCGEKIDGDASGEQETGDEDGEFDIVERADAAKT